MTPHLNNPPFFFFIFLDFLDRHLENFQMTSCINIVGEKGPCLTSDRRITLRKQIHYDLVGTKLSVNFCGVLAFTAATKFIFHFFDFSIS